MRIVRHTRTAVGRDDTDDMGDVCEILASKYQAHRRTRHASVYTIDTAYTLERFLFEGPYFSGMYSACYRAYARWRKAKRPTTQSQENQMKKGG